MMYQFRGQFIWDEHPKRKNTWMIFQKKVFIDEKITDGIINIGVDSVYYLSINQKRIVLNGGLNRGPALGVGYYDEVNISDYLIIGENTIEILVWYYGNQGRNSLDSGNGYLIADLIINKKTYSTNDSWKVKPHLGYIEAKPPLPSNLYAGYNICFDSTYNIENAPFINGIVIPIKNNILEKRPIPLFKDYGVKEYKSITKKAVGDVIEYHCKLPYGSQITPLFEIECQKIHQLVSIKTDRYLVNGGPGDHHNVYRGHRIDYLTKKGRQTFEGLNWLFGETIIYTIQKDIIVHSLTFRESGYDCELSGYFSCDNEILNKLYKKSQRTLYSCMRDNFMDCPDRERGQWIGDVSSQIPQVFYSLSRNADALVKKAINDFINFRKGDILQGNVPGGNSSELITQSLNAISPLGMIMTYYMFTKDKELLLKCYEPIISYLKLWKFNQNNHLISRKGDWYWCDHGNNVDKEIIEICWYYFALQTAADISEILGMEKDKKYIIQSRKKISNYFHDKYYKDNGYRSCNILDDRANGMVLLVGLCDKSAYNQVINVLKHTYQATPYMEYYILEALFQHNEYDIGMKRLLDRYTPMALSECSTLWEDFHIFGTYNHAWSGGVMTIIMKYLVNASFSDEKKKFFIKPNKKYIKNIIVRF